MPVLRETLVVCIMIAGCLLLIYGFNQDTPRLQRIPTIALGSLLFLLPLSTFYVGASINQKIRMSENQQIRKLENKKISRSEDLKIIDWCLIMLLVLVMPAFDLLDVQPILWFLLVVLPCIATRLIVSWFVRKPMKSLVPRQPLIYWDDAGMWLSSLERKDEDADS